MTFFNAHSFSVLHKEKEFNDYSLHQDKIRSVQEQLKLRWNRLKSSRTGNFESTRK